MLNLKSKTTSGLKWSAVERLGTQMVQLVVMLMLARMLGPQAFGLIGMLAVFIALSQVFVDSGMSSALIRKQNRDERDFSTAFIFNVFIGLLCYAVLFLCAPLVARFYEQAELVPLLRVLGCVVIVNSFALVQRAKLSIAMDFKMLAVASLIAVAVSTVVALYLAYINMGVWALVGQTLSFSLCSVVMLNILKPWRPQYGFVRDSFNELFGFGSKLLIASLLDSIYKNIYQLVIGKQFTPTDVGYFAQADQLTKMPVTTMTMIIQRVTYPMLSSIQHQPTRLDDAYILTLRFAALAIFPLMMGLSVVADPLIPALLGNEWKPTATLVSILALGLLLYPIHAINLNYLQVKGRSDLFLKLEVIKKIITTIILIISLPYGLLGICIGIAVQSYIALFINTYYNGRLSQLTLMRQLSALFPIFIISCISCIVAWGAVSLFSLTVWVKLICTITIAIVFYIGAIRFFQNDLYKHIYTTLFNKKTIFS